MKMFLESILNLHIHQTFLFLFQINQRLRVFGKQRFTMYKTAFLLDWNKC